MWLHSLLCVLSIRKAVNTLTAGSNRAEQLEEGRKAARENEVLSHL